MSSAQDHKRAGDGDTGLNTGGMGNFSPSPFYTEEVDKFCKKYIYQPTVDAMAAEGRPFKGVIFFGLMLTPTDRRCSSTMPASAIRRHRLSCRV